MYLYQVLLVVACAAAFSNGMTLENRIINGTEVDKDHPWVSRIVTQYEDTPDGLALSTNCGGSLIRKNWVLTAKHCIVDKNVKPFSDTYHVSVGNKNYIYGQFIKVSDYYFFSKETQLDDDLALLKLEEDANADPIPVQTKPFDYSGRTVRLYGWGKTIADDDNSQVVELRQTDVILKNKDDCDPTTACFDPTKTQTNSCEGDSGGPMTDEFNGKEKLIGVTHVGQIVDGVPCSGTFSSYTLTSHPPYAKWIKKTIDENS